jgi:hypothetical protein
MVFGIKTSSNTTDAKTDHFEDTLRTLIQDGREIGAIKLFREKKHCSLKEAKDYVDSLKQAIQNVEPHHTQKRSTQVELSQPAKPLPTRVQMTTPKQKVRDVNGSDDTRRIKKRWDYPRVSSEAKSSLIVLTAIGLALLGFATLIVFNNYDPSATYQRYHGGTPVGGPISGRELQSNWLLWAALLGFCGFALTIGGIKEFLKEWADVRRRRKDILEREKNKR